MILLAGQGLNPLNRSVHVSCEVAVKPGGPGLRARPLGSAQGAMEDPELCSIRSGMRLSINEKQPGIALQ